MFIQVHGLCHTHKQYIITHGFWTVCRIDNAFDACMHRVYWTHRSRPYIRKTSKNRQSFKWMYVRDASEYVGRYALRFIWKRYNVKVSPSLYRTHIYTHTITRSQTNLIPPAYAELCDCMSEFLTFNGSACLCPSPTVRRKESERLGEMWRWVRQ